MLSIMTQYERLTVAEYIHGLKEKYRPMIEAGAVGQWYAAAHGVVDAQANVENERRKIVNSYDTAKLANELLVMETRVDQAVHAHGNHPDLAALKEIYEEAQDSGDRLKQRAAAEVYQSLVSKIPAGLQDRHGHDARMVTNRLEVRAANDLEALKITPALIAALEAKDKKRDELKRAENLIFDTADALGGLNPNGTMNNAALVFITALESVTQDEEGNFSIKE